MWSADGEWIYYSDTNGEDTDIYRGRVASSVPPEPFLVREADQSVSDIREDRLLFTVRPPENANREVWSMSLEAGAEPELVVGGPVGAADGGSSYPGSRRY